MTWEWREEKTPWEIKDDFGAEWAIQQILDAKEKLAVFKEHYAQQLKALEAECHDKVSCMEAKLEAYFDKLPHRVSATQESYNLPSARLIRKKQNPEFRRDDDVLLPWVANTAPECAVSRWEIRWGELKKRLTIVDGQAVDADTGEIVPGITVEERGETFLVSLRDKREA